jgi:hypothetical protein
VDDGHYGEQQARHDGVMLICEPLVNTRVFVVYNVLFVLGSTRGWFRVEDIALLKFPNSKSPFFHSFGLEAREGRKVTTIGMSEMRSVFPCQSTPEECSLHSTCSTAEIREKEQFDSISKIEIGFANGKLKLKNESNHH